MSDEDGYSSKLGISGRFTWHSTEPATGSPHGSGSRVPHPPVTGTVIEWRVEDGWGVLRTPDGLDVWCHYSNVDMDRYRVLAVGQSVTFDYETPGQDGYPARVRSSARPVE